VLASSRLCSPLRGCARLFAAVLASSRLCSPLRGCSWGVGLAWSGCGVVMVRSGTAWLGSRSQPKIHRPMKVDSGRTPGSRSATWARVAHRNGSGPCLLRRSVVRGPSTAPDCVLSREGAHPSHDSGIGAVRGRAPEAWPSSNSVAHGWAVM
jgi:hypothetical protein